MDYKITAPLKYDEHSISRQKVLLPFNPIVLDFIDTLSKKILKNNSFRKFPELISMAFWMRKANILKLKKEYDRKRANRLWIGRGIVFHIAPSNVDSIFIYSWFLSMIVGNINIVRISSRLDEQVNLLIKTINEMCTNLKFDEVVCRFLIVSYEHNEEITRHFSSICDMRVIWGGDDTVQTIRKISISPKASEITFPDRFSLCLIKADTFLAETKKEAIIDNFYNDAFWFGQMACSSPKLIGWIGKDEVIEKSRAIFWEKLKNKIIQKNPKFTEAIATNKLVAEYSIAIQNPDIKIEKSEYSLINRIMFKSQKDIRRDLHCGGGFFYEIKLTNINEITDLITKKEQTVSVFGFNKDEIIDFIIKHKPEGIDRFVSIGNALNFSEIWDGHDILREFCREINIDLTLSKH